MVTKRILVCTLLSFFLNGFGQAATQSINTPPAESVQSRPLNIAIIDLEGRGISSDEALTLSDRLRNMIVQTGTFAVIERSQMNEILKEQGFQQSGCTSDECMVQMGQLMGVERIVAGSIGRVGDIYLLSLRMVDIQSGKIIAMVDEEVEGRIENILKYGIKNAITKLLGGKVPVSDVKVDATPASNTAVTVTARDAERPSKSEPLRRRRAVVAAEVKAETKIEVAEAAPVPAVEVDKLSDAMAILTPRYTFAIQKTVSGAAQWSAGIEWDSVRTGFSQNVVGALNIAPLNWLVIPLDVEYRYWTYKNNTRPATATTYPTGGSSHTLTLIPRVFAGYVAKYGFVYGGIGWSHSFFLGGNTRYSTSGSGDSTVETKVSQPYSSDLVLDVTTGLRLSFFRPYALFRVKSNTIYFGSGFSFAAAHEWLLFNIQWMGWNVQRTVSSVTGGSTTINNFNNSLYFCIGVNIH